ncbi:MAG: PaaX family transcriptional regulator C-terminal domain-containing protein [Candidatus Aminicenantia bacterium]
MAKSKISKKILKISEGILASLTDLILVLLNYTYEVTIDQRAAHSLPYALAKMDKRMQELNYQSIKRAIIYAQGKGWIKEDLEVTKEGQKKLRGLFQEYFSPPKWDGNWYLVNFDVPETLCRKRNILRENLKILGFGKLQNSIWICPYNFLGDIEKVIKENNLTPYVILSISNKVGQIASKLLAKKIWKISEIQKNYKEFIAEFEEEGDPSLSEVFFKYHSILRADPRLPKELLPEDWPGEEAYRLYCKLIKKRH